MTDQQPTPKTWTRRDKLELAVAATCTGAAAIMLVYIAGQNSGRKQVLDALIRH